MKFFVPDAEDPEAIWEMMRERCNAPPSDQRIYSITFDHDGDLHTATVGQPVMSRERIPERSKRWRAYSDNLGPDRQTGATVIAIFEGTPYFVWQKPESTKWENPFMVGQASIQSSIDFER